MPSSSYFLLTSYPFPMKSHIALDTAQSEVLADFHIFYMNVPR